VEPPQPRALPTSDLAALLGVLAVVHGELLAGELPPAVVRRLIDRLTRHGPLPEGASAGQLQALFGDLGQRLHWAMGGDSGGGGGCCDGDGDGYPEAAPRETTYHLDVPDGAVEACAAELRGLGGDVRPGPAGARAAPGRRRVSVVFPDLAPDPEYHARVDRLSAVARRHGGEFAGAGT
jgi:hypothetical protein